VKFLFYQRYFNLQSLLLILIFLKREICGNSNIRGIFMVNETTIYIKDRREKEKSIKDAIFALSGGQKTLLIKGEGQEISTAVEVAEILKNRMFPGIEIANISLGSRPFFQRNLKNNRYNNKSTRDNKNNQKDIISRIEILLKTKTYT
jgi:DNA-binding protein Alba